MSLTGVEGDLSRIDSGYQIDGSYIAGADIPFGAVVELSTAGPNIARAYANTGPILGIAIRDPRKGFTRDSAGLATEVLKFTAGDEISLLRQGSCFVKVGSGVTVSAGKQVYVVKVVGTGDPGVGSFVDADFTSGTGGSKAPIFNSYWRVGGTNTAVGEIVINLPGGAVS